MSLAELFSASGAPHQLQALHMFAKKLDDLEAHLATLRPLAGLDENWLPQAERRNSAPRFSPVTWLEKLGGCNGTGDINRYNGELAAGMDRLEAKLSEMVGKFAPPPAPEEPRMTRAEWEAMSGYDAADHGVIDAPRRPGRPRKEA